MSAMWIKICGVTRREDAQLAARLGVDAIGFVMHAASPRQCEVEAARDMIRQLPNAVQSVGVWLDEPGEVIAPIAERIGCSCVQTYDMTVARELALLGFAVLPALKMPTNSAASSICSNTGRVIADLGRRRGRQNDGPKNNQEQDCEEITAWRALRASASSRETQWILAGGLSCENIGAALDRFRPDGVDAASGLESAPGFKDREKLIRFVEEVRGWREKAISAPTAVDSYPRR